MTEQEREDRDAKLLKTLALLRVLEFEQAVRLIFKGVESTADATLTRYAMPGKSRGPYLHFFNKANDEKPIAGLKFCALTEEGAAKAGMVGHKIDSRSWGFGPALDAHLSTSVFVVESILAGNKEKVAMRWERDELKKIFGGVEFTPQVPWVVKKQAGRTVVWRVYSGADSSEVQRKLHDLREKEEINRLLELGDIGLLVLTPTEQAKQTLARDLRSLTKQVRLIIHEAPNTQTVVKYIDDHYRTKA
jgi:hypothetical protein